jgi:hypothetical protein
MAKSARAKSKNSQNGHRMRKSGGHAGSAGYNEGINRQMQSDPARRGPKA